MASRARPRGLARAGYRVRQVLLGVRPALQADEVATLTALLDERSRSLFMAMDARDRRHSMDMVHWLRAHALPRDELLVAALLHDVGKGHVRVRDRVLFVLLGAGGRWGRALRDGLARPGAAGARGAFWRLAHHARLGDAMLEGCTERVRWLVARHTDVDPPRDEELEWLMAADNAC